MDTTNWAWKQSSATDLTGDTVTITLETAKGLAARYGVQYYFESDTSTAKPNVKIVTE